MIRIEIGKGLRLRQAFFSYSRTAGYFPRERSFIRKHLCIPGAEAVFLVAFEGRGIRGRAYTWRLSNGQGFFAFLEGEAVKELTQRLLDLHRQWGSRELYGPVFPSGAGVFLGTCSENSADGRGEFTSPAQTETARALESTGFRKSREYLSYRLTLPEENPFFLLARKAALRYSLSLCRLHRLPPCLTLEDAVYSVEKENSSAAARNARALSAYLPRGCQFAVKNAAGEILGYAIGVGRETGRVMSLMTVNNSLRPCVALLLTSALAQKLMDGKRKTAELSVVDAENTSSRRLIHRLGAEQIRNYAEYYTKIT